MSNECEVVHNLARSLEKHGFPFDESKIPSNGIYILFERGEKGHHGERIVRVGTHTGTNQLSSRLKQHFLIENKDRSIFRKNIGRALLNKIVIYILNIGSLTLLPKRPEINTNH